MSDGYKGIRSSKHGVPQFDVSKFRDTLSRGKNVDDGVVREYQAEVETVINEKIQTGAQTTQDYWHALCDTLVESAGEVLGRSRCTQPDWFVDHRDVLRCSIIGTGYTHAGPKLEDLTRCCMLNSGGQRGNQGGGAESEKDWFTAKAAWLQDERLLRLVWCPSWRWRLHLALPSTPAKPN